jgi:uncharacterized protein YvpB
MVPDKTMPLQNSEVPPPVVGSRWVQYTGMLICGIGAILLAGWAALLPTTGEPAASSAKQGQFVAVVRPTMTAIPTVAPSPTVVARAEVLPESVRLEVPNRKQERTLNCELRSATDLAEYYGVIFTWETLFTKVGYDSNGDPNEGFVGKSIDDPSGGIYPNGYGVHAIPIARGLQAMGLNAVAHQGQNRLWLQEQLAAGHPVIVWATGGLDPGYRVEWQTLDGRTVWGVPFEHTFTAVGYDPAGIWLNDPFGGTTDYYPWATFETAWALLDHMAVTIQE